MNWHMFWLWMWFVIGIGTYMLKRAYYLVTGPNPVANTYSQFLHKCWIPLLVRGMIDSGVYWLTFYPDMFDWAIKLTGLNYQMHSAVPQYAVVSFFVGLSVDSIVDFAVTKIPYAKDFLPQMPPGMKGVPENVTS